MEIAFYTVSKASSNWLGVTWENLDLIRQMESHVDRNTENKFDDIKQYTISLL